MSGGFGRCPRLADRMPDAIEQAEVIAAYAQVEWLASEIRDTVAAYEADISALESQSDQRDGDQQVAEMVHSLSICLRLDLERARLLSLTLQTKRHAQPTNDANPYDEVVAQTEALEHRIAAIR